MLCSHRAVFLYDVFAGLQKEGKSRVCFPRTSPAEVEPPQCCSVCASLPLRSLWRGGGHVCAIASSLRSSTLIALASAGFSPRAAELCKDSLAITPG